MTLSVQNADIFAILTHNEEVIQGMETAEIIKLLPTLSIEDRLAIANIALDSIEADERVDIVLQERQLKIAANLAVDDYNNDRELTIFTNLDGEDFLE